MSGRPQSFENHAKMVPGYHFVGMGLLFVVLVLSIWRLVREPSVGTLTITLLVVAVMIVAFYARIFALGVQDRLIRLEERLRMQRLLPEELQPVIPTLTTAQLIALRFASDEELAELTQRVVDEGITDRTEIKKLVRQWRADFERI